MILANFTELDGGYLLPPTSQLHCQFGSLQSCSHVRLFVTPWTAACQPSLSITYSWRLLKLMFIKLVMPSNHLITSPESLSLNDEVSQQEVRSDGSWRENPDGCQVTVFLINKKLFMKPDNIVVERRTPPGP